MSSKRLLVAGATGKLGAQVVAQAAARGYLVRALGRSEASLDRLEDAQERFVGDALDHETVRAALKGVDYVFSCLGASVAPNPKAGSATYRAVDTPANLNLLEAARAQGVAKFVYVSVACHRELAHLAYVRAHEEVVEALQRSGVPYAVLRPTGFFSAFAAFVDLAEKGPVPVMGDPGVRTNPIADEDLAKIGVDALQQDLGELELGGPEVLSRGEIIAAAFEAVGRPVKMRRVPSWIVRAMLPAMSLYNRRLADITRFYLDVSSRDCLAPSMGERRLGEFFRQRQGRGDGGLVHSPAGAPRV